MKNYKFLMKISIKKIPVIPEIPANILKILFKILKMRHLSYYRKMKVCMMQNLLKKDNQSY